MRTIFHCDINNCFASIEIARNPNLNRFPLAVCGDPDKRKGIVLAKSESAKACGVKTGDTLWVAKQKCPNIQFVLPHYELYLTCSQQIQKFYAQFTPVIEPFGIDECWLDMTSASLSSTEQKLILANHIRTNIKRLFNVTISVGISFNKSLAKLASDMKKPDAVTYIGPDNFKNQIWQLPASDLIGVGRSTTHKLQHFGILSIGDLANANPAWIHKILGKNGLMVWGFANGFDDSPVIPTRDPRQSLGHGTTLPQNAHSSAALWPTIKMLSEKIAFELQDEGFIAWGIQIYVRDSALQFHQSQKMLHSPISAATVIQDYALMMLSQSYDWLLPIRAFGIRLFLLEPQNTPKQLPLFPNHAIDIKNSQGVQIDSLMRNIQKKFGNHAIQRGMP